VDLLKKVLALFRSFRDGEASAQTPSSRLEPGGTNRRTDSNTAQAIEGALRPKETPPKESERRVAPKRGPHYIQIGLDFGTSYCKVVCRDINKNKAWVHTCKLPADKERPFLLPSALWSDGVSLSLASVSAHYHEGGLPHVKIALARVAMGDFDDPFVRPFYRGNNGGHEVKTKKFVFVCAVYLLGGILAEVRRGIRTRIADFGEHPDDYEAVSLAVPVADAEKPDISKAFRSVLGLAFLCSGKLEGFPKVALSEFAALVERARNIKADFDEFKFFVYPEVSAGVQGFVRSRVSKDGIYVFSETGAGTVDQSVFILFRPRGEDARLTYLNARVLPLGSSRIEWHAAEGNGHINPETLELWRRRKEAGENAAELRLARHRIGEELAIQSYHTLGVARRKLTMKAQFGEIRAMFGGGGHTRVPYERFVLDAFANESLPLHGRQFVPDVIRLPIPKDLEPEREIRHWMNRLWIAYGLSFFPGDYPRHRYPQEVPDSVTIISKPSFQFVSKDMC